MPHSSGGGSHGGGSHGGSHRSSRSGGSRGTSGPSYSRRPHSHYRRYSYYDRRGREQYIYCSERPKRMSTASFIMTFVFMIPFVIAGIVLTYVSLNGIIPLKLKPQYITPQSHIEDTAGCIDNTSDLEDVLEKFEQKTGICPYILTIEHADWVENYTSLETYAYTAYLERFSDEQHFLLVYSDPHRADTSVFSDWYWEGMQGDDTDAIISETHFRKFQTRLHSGLVRENVSVGEAIEDAFTDSLGYMMKISVPSADKLETLIFVFIWDLFVVFAFAGIINSWINSRRQYYDEHGNSVSDSLSGMNTSLPDTSGNYGTQYSGYNTRSYGGGYGYQNSSYGSGRGDLKFSSDPDAVQNGNFSSYDTDSSVSSRYQAQNANYRNASPYDVSHIGFDQPATHRKPGDEMDEISFDDIYGQRTYNSSSDSYQGPEIK